MPRIHSWQEVIAPRDCWYILHWTTLRPAVDSTTSNLQQPRTPIESHSVPITPCIPPWRNEQRAISLLLNACHKSPRAPSRSSSPCAHPLAPPSATLSRFSPLFHLFSPEDSTLTCTTPHLLFCFLRLNFSALCFIAFILTSSLYLFPPILRFFHLVAIYRKEGENRERTDSAYSALFTVRHYLKKNNNKRISEWCAFLRHFFLLSSRSLFLHNFLLYRVLICLRNERIATWRFNRCNRKREEWMLQYTSMDTSQAFSVLHSICAFHSLPRPRDCR